MIQNNPLRRRWLIELTGRCGYPVAFACASLAGWMALDVGVGLWPAAYVAAATGIITVVLVEFFAPYRAGWRSRADSLRLDLVYLMVVQIGLPLALAATVADVALSAVESSGGVVLVVWPHDWPLAIQVGLVLLLAEFPRYGLHRFLHCGRGLWRFHALHHAPALHAGLFRPALDPEGAFGTRLLRDDLVETPLMFSDGGWIDSPRLPEILRDGLGLAIVHDRVQPL